MGCLPPAFPLLLPLQPPSLQVLFHLLQTKVLRLWDVEKVQIMVDKIFEDRKFREPDLQRLPPFSSFGWANIKLKEASKIPVGPTQWQGWCGCTIMAGCAIMAGIRIDGGNVTC